MTSRTDPGEDRLGTPHPAPPRARTLALQLGGALLAATVLAIAVVLPAEYRVDPTGFGALTGLTRLSAPTEVEIGIRTAAPPEILRAAGVPFRSDTVEIQVDGQGGFLSDLEYKITMAAGETVVFSWSAPSDLHFEFHGHTHPDPETGTIEVMTYQTGAGAASHGVLTAPMDGIHGWYFRNDGSEPATVQLELSGYYELAPGLLF